jgi:hypothetical protein
LINKMDSAQRFIERNRARRSRQEALDDALCRPGYTYNETLDRCLPAAGGSIDSDSEPPTETPGDTPPAPDAPATEGEIAEMMAAGGMESIPNKSPANEAVAKEMAMRKRVG